MCRARYIFTHLSPELALTTVHPTTAPFLDSLPGGLRAALVARGTPRRYRAGEVMWTEGAASHGITLVTEGRFRIVRTSANGRQTTLHWGLPGETLGEVAFFSGGAYPATAIAAAPSRCLYFDRAAISQAIAQEPALAWHFFERLAARVRLLVDRVDSLASHGVRSRVASYLLALARDATVNVDGSTVVRLGLTQQELAEELGTVREVIVRALRALREEGVVRSARGGRFEILDRANLERIAGA